MSGGTLDGCDVEDTANSTQDLQYGTKELRRARWLPFSLPDQLEWPIKLVRGRNPMIALWANEKASARCRPNDDAPSRPVLAGDP
jgi:hypothetical protein